MQSGEELDDNDDDNDENQILGDDSDDSSMVCEILCFSSVEKQLRGQ